VRLLFLVLVAACAVQSSRVSYEGQQVLRCGFDNSSIISRLDSLDVWGVHPGQTVDVRVKNPQQKELAEKLLTACEVMIPDLEADVQHFEALNLEARNRANAEWFEAYHTYDEIVQWYQDAANKWPDLLTFIQSIGLSGNNRSQPALRIWNKSRSNPNLKPTKRIYWQAQIHAREWISGATVNFIVQEIINDYYADDALLATLLDTVEIIVVPFVNPDGYVYTWTDDRMWRKNRRNTGAICIGVDNNRNYNDHWGQGGSSNQPCSDTYMGPFIASEPENQNTQTFFKDLQSDVPIHGAIDWHSYSQLILRPYGWTINDSPDEAIFKQVGDEMAAIIKNVSGLAYTSQKSIELYITTGTASDWFYGTDASKGNHGVRTYSYTIELRPAGNPPGFELPPTQIIPTGKENYAAIRYWLDFINKNPITS